MTLDCIVIGGGQSGLYAAQRLSALNMSYLVLERNRVGDAWRNRMEGMRLFTSRQFCALPGLPFPGEQEGFPQVMEMADYLTAYARHFGLGVKEGAAVAGVTVEDELFVVRTRNGDHYQAKALINATGSNQLCIVPAMANQLSQDVLQYTADTRSFGEVPKDARVLVVGDGASGRQIAARLTTQCAEVTLATGANRALPPNRVLGKDLFWWLKKLGILFADKNSLIARVLKKRNPVPCRDVNNRKLKASGVKVRGRCIRCDGREAVFECGSRQSVDVVVWAVGYRDDTNWLHIDKCVEGGEFKQEYGVTPQPGLFVVGRKWLSCRASELILGVERDVDLVVDHLSSYLGRTS